MVKPIHLKPHKLNDEIVKDSIRAVNHLKKEKNVEGRLTGGMAIQSYIPENLHRGTIDLDFSLIWQGSTTAFKELCSPLINYLEDKNYNVSATSKGLAREFLLNKNKPKKDSFVIQHPDRSKKHFKKIKKSLEREVNNQRTINKGDLSYDVLSPEDLVMTKLNRVSVFLKEYDLKVPRDISTEGLIQYSGVLRNELLLKGPESNVRDLALFRLINDCYDIRCLSENVGFNKNYFNEVANDWKMFKPDSRKIYNLLDKLEISLK